MNPCIPEHIEGYGPVRRFAGAFASTGTVTRAPVRVCGVRPGAAKVLPSIRAAIEACGLKDGATVSFHHLLRNGDDVLRAVMAEIAALGLRTSRSRRVRSSPFTLRWWSTSAPGS